MQLVGQHLQFLPLSTLATSDRTRMQRLSESYERQTRRKRELLDIFLSSSSSSSVPFQGQDPPSSHQNNELLHRNQTAMTIPPATRSGDPTPGDDSTEEGMQFSSEHYRSLQVPSQTASGTFGMRPLSSQERQAWLEEWRSQIELDETSRAEMDDLAATLGSW